MEAHAAPALAFPLAPPDPAALAALRAGEPAALTRLFHAEASGLLALAYRLLLSRDEAEDVVQDLFVGLPEALVRYEERGQFRAWLRAIVVRLCLMRLRRARRTAGGPALVDDTPASAFPDTVTNLALLAALAELPPDLRAVVVLKVIEGYTHEEIAALLGIRRNTSEVRLHRALARLRSALGDL